MTQTVTLENGDVLEFPDTMSPSTMEALVKQHTNKPTTATDVGKAALYAPAKAAVGIAGLPGDARDLAGLAKSKLSQYLPDWLNTADRAVNAVNPLNQFVRVLPTSGELRGAAERVTGPWYDPQTRAGKVADTAIQTATTMGRNLVTAPLRSGLLTTGITAGTEGAGALTDDNPWARAAGGVFGGGIPALFNAMKSRAGTVAKDAIGDLSPQQIQDAIQTQSLAQRLGIPLMGTESLDRGHQLASAVYAHPSGNQTIENFLRARPAQVSNAVDTGLLAQTGPRATPSANAARAQSTAEDVISGLEKDRTNLVAPDYMMAKREFVNPKDVALARADLQAAALAAPESQRSQFTPFITDLAAPNASNASVLDQIYKQARDAANLPINASTADKQAAAAARIAAPTLERLTQQSPSLVRGRQQYRDFTQNEIEPVTSGPVGVVAGRSGFDPSAPSAVPRVTATVADANTARPETIRELYTNLNRQDRQAFPGIVQTHIENQLNTALGDIRSGANPTAGAKFRQAIAGTPQERANFDEMMRGVARAQGVNPDAVVRGANNLLDVLDRTGRTPGIGSPTATRGEVNREMGKTLLGDTLSTISLTPTKPLARRLDDWIQRSRYADVAKALTAPDSVQKLVQLAKYQPNSLTASFYVATMLGFDRAIAADQ